MSGSCSSQVEGTNARCSDILSLTQCLLNMYTVQTGSGEHSTVPWGC